MVTRITHCNIYVHDQDEALKFYRDILGMEVRADINQRGFRWLTVGPKAQPDFEIVLMDVKAVPGMRAEAAEQLASLLKQGALSAGVLQTDDAMRDYKEWSEKGVEFIDPPTEQFYGIGAAIRDFSGNRFTLLQPKTK